MKGLIARDIISANVVPVQAESRLADVLAKAGNTRATHALVYDGEIFCGVVPLNASTVIQSRRIFADLLPRVSPQMIPDSTPIEAIVSMLSNSGGDVVGVVSANGIFIGIISQEALLRALLDDSRLRLEEFSSSNEKQEKFRIIGLMASGIAHDLNNILTAVLINLELLDLKEFSGADEKEQLHIALTATRDAAGAVHCLQNFYCPNGSTEVNDIFDLSVIAGEVKQFTQPKWHSEAQKNGKTIALELDLSDVPPVRGNQGEIREVLTNLVINAIDAIAEKGVIRMSVYEKAGFVFVDVADSGSGMDDEQQSHCFEPFYTTKAAMGTGLGLSICRNIMSKHGGHIEFETVAGKGTTFRICLPAAATEDRTIIKKPGEIERKRILLVENNPQTSAIMTKLLQKLGQEVETAANGKDALLKFHTVEYNLVITGETFPESDGYELAYALKEIRPLVPVVLVTGWEVAKAAEGKTPKGKPDLTIAQPVSFDTFRQVLKRFL